MRAIILDTFRTGLKLKKDIPVLKPLKHKNLLIKVDYANINPSDLGFTSGVYGRKKYIEKLTFPLVPGFEGSGRIVEVIDNSHKNLLNKKVSFCVNYESEK